LSLVPPAKYPIIAPKIDRTGMTTKALPKNTIAE